MKRCSRCGETKSHAEFNRRSDTPDRLQYYCRSCMGKSQSPKRKRDGHLKRKYGITPDDYDNMFYAQDGACAICREEPKAETRLHVDHDHNTSAVRGLLCGTCNKGIGLFRDSRQLLFQAVEYLDSHAFTGTTEKP